MVLSELIIRNYRRYPKKEALISGDLRLTYEELYIRIKKLSNALYKLGIRRGDKIAILLENCHQYIELLFAVTQKGFIGVPLNYRLSGKELSYIINDSETIVIVSCEKYLSQINSIRGEIRKVKTIISVDGGEDALDYETLIKNSVSEEINADTIPDRALAFIMYTSGTTGKPKGAMITHNNVFINSGILSWCYHYLEPYDRTLNIAPFYHIGASSVAITHVYAGATNVILKKFSPKDVLETIEKEKITNFWMAPNMLNTLINHPDISKYDLSSLRKITYAGSPMPVSLLQKCVSVFGKIFIQLYGLTEASPSMTTLPLEDNDPDASPQKLKRLESVGKEDLNTQVRVVNLEGNDVKPGEVGEIIGKGDNMMIGYWKLPKETSDVLKDGWLYTGDLATVDEDGYIYIVDRKKDMIISGGENIYSVEVEEAIYKHPDVLEAAVIGIPDTMWGEAVMACIVLKPGSIITEDDIIQHCKANLASYKKPKHIKFFNELPKSPTGKILKKDLRKLM